MTRLPMPSPRGSNIEAYFCRGLARRARWTQLRADARSTRPTRTS
jgi:hypothetical protein